MLDGTVIALVLYIACSSPWSAMAANIGGINHILAFICNDTTCSRVNLIPEDIEANVCLYIRALHIGDQCIMCALYMNRCGI